MNTPKAPTVKLTRIIEGLYRNDNGTIIIARDNRGPDADCLPWTVRYNDGLGCRIIRRFRIFNEARRFVAFGCRYQGWTPGR